MFLFTLDVISPGVISFLFFFAWHFFRLFAWRMSFRCIVWPYFVYTIFVPLQTVFVEGYTFFQVVFASVRVSVHNVLFP